MKRKSNIEALRIFTMLLIIMSHFSGHGVWSPDFGGWDASNPTSLLTIQMLGVFGKAGVNLFVMITGWFMVESRFKTRSFLRVALEAWFYAVACLVAFAVRRGGAVTIDQIACSVVPLVYTNWFVATYLALYLLVPLLNLIAHKLTRSYYRGMLIAMGFVLSVIPTATYVLPSLPDTDFLSNGLVWFVFLYLLAGYWRMYGFETSGRISAVLSGASLACIWGWVIYCNALGTEYCASAMALSGQMSLFALVLSAGLFRAFSGWGLGYHPAVNTLASGAFGVYLMHDNDFVRPWLWRHFGFAYALPPLGIVVVALGAAIVLYTALALADVVRQRLIEAPVFRLLERTFGDQMDRLDDAMGNM